MSERKEVGISRRAFLAGGSALAAGLFLPKIPGTLGSFLVPFRLDVAWADGAGATANIMVVGRKQMGIAVGDIGTLDSQKKDHPRNCRRKGDTAFVL